MPVAEPLCITALVGNYFKGLYDISSKCKVIIRTPNNVMKGYNKQNGLVMLDSAHKTYHRQYKQENSAYQHSY